MWTSTPWSSFWGILHGNLVFTYWCWFPALVVVRNLILTCKPSQYNFFFIEPNHKILLCLRLRNTQRTLMRRRIQVMMLISLRYLRFQERVNPNNFTKWASHNYNLPKALSWLFFLNTLALLKAWLDVPYYDWQFTTTKNRMLLWHGSRLTNWMGILSQGYIYFYQYYHNCFFMYHTSR